MKRTLAYCFRLFFAVFLIFATACTKHHMVSDNACIERVAFKAQLLLGKGLMDSLDTLLSTNHISTDTVLAQSFRTFPRQDSTQAAVSELRTDVFINGLPVFYVQDEFFFASGLLDSTFIYHGLPPGNDTIAHQSLAYLRSSFLQYAPPSYTQSASGSLVIIPPAQTYAQTCLSATLGYLDGALIPGSRVTPHTTLVKVWWITPTIQHAPVVYVEDDNGFAWPMHYDLP